jgi:hypothetical protein
MIFENIEVMKTFECEEKLIQIQVFDKYDILYEFGFNI